MHEGIPILNFLVPKAFTHDNGKLTGMIFEKVAAELRRQGPPQAVPTGEPDRHFECDDVLVAIGQENAFPWIERDIGLEFDKWGMPVVDKVTMQSTHAEACSSAATRRSARRTSSGRSRTATTRRSRSTSSCTARTSPSARRRRDARVAEDGHPRVELRQRRSRPTCATRCRWRTSTVALQDIKVEVELGFDSQTACDGSAALPQLRRADGVRDRAVHRVRRLRRHLPDGLHHVHGERRGGRAAHAAARAGAATSTQDLYVSGALKTGRVMAKDEDVCLHCGLCAERCPTGAWDMQKFLLDMTHAGRGAATRARAPKGRVT